VSEFEKATEIARESKDENLNLFVENLKKAEAETKK